MDRATRWVFVQIKNDKTAANAHAFLKALHKACPIRNGMVERFNSRIADVLKTHRFNSQERARLADKCPSLHICAKETAPDGFASQTIACSALLALQQTLFHLESRPMQAAWMIAAALLFALMSVCIKYASPYFGPLEIVCYRGAIGMVFVWALTRSRGVTLATRVPFMHVWRNVVGVSALTAWFYSIAYLPLATAMTLNYMSGVWVAAFLVSNTLLTGRLADMRRQGPLVLAVLASFGGVVLMLRPTLGQHQLFAGLVGLFSGVLSALAYVQVAALGRVGEPEARTVFYFSVGATLAGGVGMLFSDRHPLGSTHALWLLPIGVLAALGQLCMTRAYTRGATMLVANLQYSGIVFAALFGLLLFDDQIGLPGWLGMATIIASGIIASLLRARPLSNPPAEEH